MSELSVWLDQALGSWTVNEIKQAVEEMGMSNRVALTTRITNRQNDYLKRRKDIMGESKNAVIRLLLDELMKREPLVIDAPEPLWPKESKKDATKMVAIACTELAGVTR